MPPLDKILWTIWWLLLNQISIILDDLVWNPTPTELTNLNRTLLTNISKKSKNAKNHPSMISRPVISPTYINLCPKPKEKNDSFCISKRSPQDMTGLIKIGLPICSTIRRTRKNYRITTCLINKLIAKSMKFTVNTPLG
jgi:hypothetical protein